MDQGLRDHPEAVMSAMLDRRAAGTDENALRFRKGFCWRTGARFPTGRRQAVENVGGGDHFGPGWLVRLDFIEACSGEIQLVDHAFEAHRVDVARFIDAEGDESLR